MRSILIFGGSFNPPTLAHEAIMRACLELPQFDAVWVMPSGSRLDKEITLSDEHRLQLLHAVQHDVFNDDSRLQISDLELQLPRPTEMYRTVHALAAKYPETEFWFAYGGDAYRSMSTWPHADSFMADLRMVVFTDYEVPDAGNGRTMHITIPQTYEDMSSTAARNALAGGKDASALLSAPVLAYSVQHNLYVSQ